MRSYVSEFVGTALLLAIVAGSGIMGETLGAGNAAVALLGNSIATGAGLFALIVLLGPISGAHFNPCVTGVEMARREIAVPEGLAYIFAQVLGALVGGFIIGVLQDSAETALNSSTDVLFTAAACMAQEDKAQASA